MPPWAPNTAVGDFIMATAAPIKFTVSERVLYPEGKHLVQVVDYAPANGQFGPQIRWRLELLDFEREDGEPAWTSYYTSMAISGKSKLGKMFMACRLPLPMDADEAAAIDPNTLIGKQFYVTLVHEMGGDGSVYANIAKDSLLPVSKEQAKANTLALPEKPVSFPGSATAQHAAANAAGENAKAQAVGAFLAILRPLEGAMEEHGQKFTPENTGEGLKAIGKAKTAQRVKKLSDVAFDMISISQIQAAQAEALALLDSLNGPAAEEGGEVDPFASE